MDPLTQIQDTIDQISEIYYTLVGVLQRDASLVPTDTKPVTSWSSDQIQKNTQELKALTLSLSESLVSHHNALSDQILALPDAYIPSNDGMDLANDQLETIKRLDAINTEKAAELNHVVRLAESLEKSLDAIDKEIVHHLYAIPSE